MEAELVGIDSWLTLNKLTPNIKKCETIFFSKPHNFKYCSDRKVKFKGKELQTKQSIKYLGVHFDSKLSWEKQIAEILRKINFKLAKLDLLQDF